MSVLPCPTCGSDLVFLEQYQRHFCYHCQKYAPEGYGAMGERKCPTCGGILSYVAAYDRFYCYRCNTYPTIEVAEPAPSAQSSAAESTPSPTGAEPSPPATPASPAGVTEPEASAPTLAALSPAKAADGLEDELEESEKPPLRRDLIREAKKPFLIDLCKAYDLNPSGTKEEIRERLLSYLAELEAAKEHDKPAAEAPESAENRAEAAPMVPETPARKAEPKPEAESVERLRLEAHPKPPDVSVVEASARPRADAGAVQVLVEAPRPPELPPQPVMKEETAPEPPLVAAGVSGTAIPAVAEVPTAPTPAVPTQGPSPPEASPVRRVEHPCPTCGRELDYISRYDRWYCYSCKAYAPASPVKHACPNCGATLRWIPQYGRWWCDGCRLYASSDLPAPRPGAPATAVPAATALATAGPSGPLVSPGPAIVVHLHRSPMSGIGLIALGLVMWLVYEVLVEFPVYLGMAPALRVPTDVGFLLRFSGFLFVALGTITGFLAARSRETET